MKVKKAEAAKEEMRKYVGEKCCYCLPHAGRYYLICTRSQLKASRRIRFGHSKSDLRAAQRCSEVV